MWKNLRSYGKRPADINDTPHCQARGGTCSGILGAEGYG